MDGEGKRSPRKLTQLLADIGPLEGAVRRSSRPKAASGRVDALVLDVRRLQLLGALQDGTMGQLVWGAEGETDRPAALYAFRREVLTIHDMVRGGRLERIDASINVEPLGIFSHSGSRPWLLCPNAGPSGTCGRRVTQLLLLGGETPFRCRFCVGRRRSLRKVRLTAATAHPLALAAAQA